MSTPRKWKPAYDVDKLQRDMARRGWLATDLAREANVSVMSVYRFLDGRARTPRMARKLSTALGKQPDHYLLDERELARQTA